uniref:GHMP_kinases_N domain-containing protein n=2 Tax=Caenorhabditis tropicalis TaxID=1561998 RepID=A0A1I7T012_9PELO
MIRAARHLETAAQKCIREKVEGLCAERSLKLTKSDPSRTVAHVTAPVRIDFFGGWLDTPPIFFSMENAAVVNMAVELDGKNPISCTITKTDLPYIELHQDGSRILIQSDEHLLFMHDQPSEPGALVAACIVALGFKTLSGLFETLQCSGLRIETISDLPHGSGLGTSSIMACTILKAFSAFGGGATEDQIVHTVLCVEQLMTTGGGWQDQCGAVYPGLKTCYYTPNGIRQRPIPLSPRVKELLEDRLLLVYTGKTRLAKNLLQEVIRNFYTCTETQKRLREMAEGVEEF